MKHDRSFYIPKGARKIAHKHSSAVVYAYEREGRPYLIGFHGRAQKPDFHYRYANDQARIDKANRFFEGIQASEDFRREQREKRKAQGHELKVGDILRSSWGYDQTNIDYYQVLRLIGKSMVEIQEIGSDGYEDSEMAMQGRVVPLVGAFKGKPMRKRADGNSVRIASYASAYKIEPKIIAGVPVYESSRNSWYA